MKHTLLYPIMLLVIILNIGTAFGKPPINYDKTTPNVFGGYNYYQNGKRVYNSTGNVWKSQNIYSNKGMELRGQQNLNKNVRYYK